MKLIVGLGNPGPQYDKTRHNIGRSLIQYMAVELGARFFAKNNLQSKVAQVEWEGHKVLLACPETYMNLSGNAVAKLVRYCDVVVENDLLIVVDDTALPFGSIRLRARGRDGGHNGLKSIIEKLKTSNYARLRLGIGMPGNRNEERKGIRKGIDITLEKYVLSLFNSSETRALTDFIIRGYEASRLWMVKPVEKAMNFINARQ